MLFDKVKCVVFDIDDTLYLERDYVRSGFRAVGNYLGYGNAFEEICWKLFIEGTRYRIFNMALKEMRLKETEDLISKLVQVYRCHEPSIELLPDARELILSLKEAYTLAIITDGPLESQRAKYNALGLSEWFPFAIFTEELGKNYMKPHPKAFEYIEQQTGYKGTDCVYIADNPKKDFQAPSLLEWRKARIRREGGLHLLENFEGHLDWEGKDFYVLNYFAR